MVNEGSEWTAPGGVPVPPPAMLEEPPVEIVRFHDPDLVPDGMCKVMYCVQNAHPVGTNHVDRTGTSFDDDFNIIHTEFDPWRD